LKTSTPVDNYRSSSDLRRRYATFFDIVFSTPARFLAVCLTGVGVGLVWSFRFLPLHDLPIWMYEVRILEELGQTGNEWAKYFLISFVPVPNLGLIAPLWLFHQVFSIEVAAKIYLSVCVATFPWSFWYGVRSISGRDTPLGYLGFPYLLNLFVFSGQAYLLGLIMFLL